MGIEGEMGISGGIQDALMMSVDEKDDLRDKDEVTVRRMKNRERQRRYRARKRMREEAGLDDENLSFQTQQKDQEEEEEEDEEEEELECDNVYVDHFVRRVYCHRDWKKEARIAHLIMDTTRDGSCLVHRKIRPRPRDWKAEARKMKT
ncbi:uncharacterized protein LOC106436991 [Brassica napus]|uniref:uncharacterized protein LOC106436991 n=1 Tax=Brassica napus TaxID=3708 RepID=UPI002078ECA8|nr:uncharacterized protein LOC106436991 [Brassica napus]XP_048635153.1 uncharacterized protein LOC106436991 [Brassica napus]